MSGDRVRGVGLLLVAVAALAPLLGFASGGLGPALASVVLLSLALLRPELSLTLLALALPLYGAAPGGPRLAWAEVQVLTLIAGFSLRAACGREQLPRTRLDGAILLYLLVGLGSLLPARYHPPSLAPGNLAALARHLFYTTDTGPWFVLRAALGLASAAALCWITVAVVRRHGTTRLLAALATGVLATVSLGLAEQAQLLSLRALRPVHPLYLDRLHSLFHHPSWLAQFLLLALPWVALGQGGGSRLARGVRLGTLVGGVLCIVLTLQRGAWIALAASALAVAVCERRRLAASPRKLALVAAAALLVVVLPLAGSSAVRGRAAELFSDMSNRSLFWAPVAAMVAERPWLGQGLGSFAWDYPRVQPVDDPGYLVFHGEAHNAYLMVLAERGIIGLLSYLFLLVALFRLALERRSRAGLAMTTALAVYGLGQYLFYVRGVELAAWIGFGLLAAGESEPAPARPRSRVILAAALVALLLVLGARALGAPFPTAPDDRSFGLHLSEPGSGGSFRWTAEFAALTLARPPGAAILELALADGAPAAAASSPLEVEILLDGRLLATVRPPRGRFAEHHLSLPPGAAGDHLVLTLRPSRCFRPASFSDTPDTRLLGVALRAPLLQPAPAPVQR